MKFKLRIFFMKNLKKLALLLPLACAANATLAANSVDIAVTGTITPAACNITLIGGDIDTGETIFSTLSPTSVNSIGVFNRSLNVACAGNTQVAFKAIDNREGSLPTGSMPSNRFGLGFDSAGNPIGSYSLRITGNNIVVDGAAGAVDLSDNGGASWNDWNGAQDLVNYNKFSRIYAFDLPSNQGGQPLPMTNGTLQFSAQILIQPSNTLDGSAQFNLDGSSTFELIYL
jgi:type 1 fimbria pilin